MLQREGLANHFKFIKEQFKKWGHSLGCAESMKKLTVVPFHLQGFFYQDLPLGMANHTHNSPCALCVLLASWGTNKVHPEHGLSQGHIDREKEVRGTEYRSNERNRVCTCSGQLHKVLDGAGTEPKLGLQRQGKALLTVNHLPFFLICYRRSNHFLVQSSGRTVAPSLWEFSGRIPKEYLEHHLFCWLWPSACGSWGSGFNMAK